MIEIGDIVTVMTGVFAGKIGEVVEILPESDVAKVRVRKGSVVVSIPLDMFEAEERSDGENFQKQRKSKQGDGDARTPDRENKHQRRKPRTTENLQNLNQEKEKREDTNTMEARRTTPAQTTATPARVEPLYCPTCPGEQVKLRKTATDLVCGDCYRSYTSEAAIALTRGPFMDLLEWAAKKVSPILNSLECQFTQASAEVNELAKKNSDEAYQTLLKNSGGRTVPREVWVPGFQNLKTQMWHARGGNIKYAKMKSLETRIALIKAIIVKASEPKPAAAPARETVAPLVVEAAVTVTNLDGQTPAPSKPKRTTKKKVAATA